MQIITRTNRQLPTMRGGWNPALRSIFTLDDGSKWFLAESGSTPNNSNICYCQFDGRDWVRRGSVMLPAGINQNLAHISDGKRFYSYGCSVTNLIQVAADPAEIKTNMTAYSTVGPLLPYGSNYTGAIFLEPDTRVVWHDVVGVNGDVGEFRYWYNHAGRGWNGPVRTALPGYNSIGYCSMQGLTSFEIYGLCQLYLGSYPHGSKRVAALRIPRLGQPMRLAVVTKTADQKQEPIDLFADKTKHTHLLLKTDAGQIEYWHAEPNRWPSGATRVSQIAASQARFCVSKKGVHLGAAMPDGFAVYTADPKWFGGPVDWSAIPSQKLAYPEGCGVPCGVWPGRSRSLLSAPEFAVCGQFPDSDHLVFSTF